MKNTTPQVLEFSERPMRKAWGHSLLTNNSAFLVRKQFSLSAPLCRDWWHKAVERASARLSFEEVKAYEGSHFQVLGLLSPGFSCRRWLSVSVMLMFLEPSPQACLYNSAQRDSLFSDPRLYCTCLFPLNMRGDNRWLTWTDPETLGVRKILALGEKTGSVVSSAHTKGSPSPRSRRWERRVVGRPALE